MNCKLNLASMKKTRMIFICLLIFALGSALGFFVGWKTGLHKGYTRTVNDYLESTQRNLEHETRAYLKCLQAIDSGSEVDISNLQHIALGRLKLYDFGVQFDRTNGFDWDDDQFYTNVTLYLASHPKK